MSLTTREGSRFGDSISSGNPLDFGGPEEAPPTALFGLVMVISILLFSAGSAMAGTKDSAPPAPNRAWTAPGMAEHQADLQSRHLEIGSEGEVNPHKVYELPDLIDLAQRLNPETKISWQRAKEALAAVGLKEVNYYPLLSAAAAAGYTRLFAPLPSISINRAALVRAIASGGSASSAISLQDSGNSLHLDILADTTLSLQWLLFDFGERAALKKRVPSAGQLGFVGY
jgi:outer membrane protein TolC